MHSDSEWSGTNGSSETATESGSWGVRMQCSQQRLLEISDARLCKRMCRRSSTADEVQSSVEPMPVGGGHWVPKYPTQCMPTGNRARHRTPDALGRDHSVRIGPVPCRNVRCRRTQTSVGTGCGTVGLRSHWIPDSGPSEAHGEAFSCMAMGGGGIEGGARGLIMITVVYEVFPDTRPLPTPPFPSGTPSPHPPIPPSVGSPVMGYFSWTFVPRGGSFLQSHCIRLRHCPQPLRRGSSVAMGVPCVIMCSMSLPIALERSPDGVGCAWGPWAMTPSPTCTPPSCPRAGAVVAEHWGPCVTVVLWNRGRACPRVREGGGGGHSL